MATAFALQAEIHARAGDLPFKRTAGMRLFHAHHVTYIELGVQHGLFDAFDRTDIGHFVTGFADLFDNIHTMLGQICTDRQLGSISFDTT